MTLPPVVPSVPLPRASATLVLVLVLVLVRESAAGPFEMLLLQRADSGDQNSLAWVFPGGLVDETDRQLHAHFHDTDDTAASERLGTAQGGLDYFAAALRETLEEAGLLLAVDRAGSAVDSAAHGSLLQEWRERSRGLPRGQGGAAFSALCSAQGWRLGASALHPIAHWITPAGLPKRFDTRFLLALAPASQPVIIDGVEIVDHRWLRPSDLLAPDVGLRLRGPARALAQALRATTASARCWPGRVVWAASRR